MKRCQYRCNKCLVIEERFIFGGQEPLLTVPCSRCGGPTVVLSDHTSKGIPPDFVTSGDHRPTQHFRYK
jgi:hypothetical protein